MDKTQENRGDARVRTEVEGRFHRTLPTQVAAAVRKVLGDDTGWGEDTTAREREGFRVWRTRPNPERSSGDVVLENHMRGRGRIRIHAPLGTTVRILEHLNGQASEQAGEPEGNCVADAGPVCGTGGRSEAERTRDQAGAAAALSGVTGWSLEKSVRVLEGAGGVGALAHPEGPRARAALGKRMLARVDAAKRLTQYAQEHAADRMTPNVATAQEAAEILVPRLKGEAVEVVGALFIDARHQPIEYREIHRGGLDGSTCSPRTIARHALGVNAIAVVLAHNHPSGNAEPSDQDYFVTDRLQEGLKTLDVNLLDHLVVTPQGRWRSIQSGGTGWVEDR